MTGVIAALIGSYVIGSIPTAYLVVRWLRRIDVRAVGSGNVGATNVTRVAGLRAGIVVFLIDMGKGMAAVWLLVPWLVQSVTPSVRLSCGAAAVVGHAFPVFLQFRGGRGVATTIGVWFSVEPLIGLWCLAVWALCVFTWRYVSVGSLAAAATFPIAQLIVQRSLSEILLGVALAVLIVLRHRDNIERLMQGREHRIGRPPNSVSRS
jgi:glycerol-3-phosphate acyltransferase PlsY